MQSVRVAHALVVMALWPTMVWAEVGLEPPAAEASLNLLGRMQPDVLPKLQQLAAMLERSIREGKLSDAQIRRELQSGNLALVIQGLGPEAGRLLDEITRSFQANHSEESLALLLRALSGSSGMSPLLPAGPPD